MNDVALVSIIVMVGWLLLVGSSLASFKLGWSKMLQIGLLWAAIFGSAFLVATLFVGA